MSFKFQSIDTNKPIFEESPIYSSDILTDSMYLQTIKEKLKDLKQKIIFYEIHHPHHKDIMKMKLTKKRIENDIFRKKNIFQV